MPTLTTFCTHASDLVTLQNAFGVAAPGGEYFGGDGGATSLADLFQPGVTRGGVPEPSTWVIMGLGLIGLVGAYRHSQGRAAKPAAAA